MILLVIIFLLNSIPLTPSVAAQSSLSCEKAQADHDALMVRGKNIKNLSAAQKRALISEFEADQKRLDRCLEIEHDALAKKLSPKY